MSLTLVRDTVPLVVPHIQMLVLHIQMLVQQHLEQQATVAAYQDCFMLVTLLSLASMLLLLLMRRSRA